MPPLSIKVSACRISLSCPGVSKKVINLPVPSQRKWILVLKPPRLSPNASCSALLFCPSSMWMGAYGCGVNEMEFSIHIAFHIQRSLQLGKPLLPNGCFSPTLKVAVNRCPLAVAFWHVTPGRAGPQRPQNTIQELPMVLCRSSTSCFAFGSNGSIRSHCSFVRSPRFAMSTSLTAILYFAYRP